MQPVQDSNVFVQIMFGTHCYRACQQSNNLWSKKFTNGKVDPIELKHNECYETRADVIPMTTNNSYATCPGLLTLDYEEVNQFHTTSK